MGKLSIKCAHKAVYLFALAAALALVGILSCGKALADKDEDWLTPGAPAAPRVLCFPSNVSVGNINAWQFWPPAPDALPTSNLAAKGKIGVNRGLFIEFRPTRQFYSIPNFATLIRNNPIDCLTLNVLPMDESEDGQCDRVLAACGQQNTIRALALDRSDATDEGLGKVTGLTNLEYISAFATGVSGACLKHLSKLKKLRTLVLDNCPLDENNLQYLADFHSLKIFSAALTGVTSKGVQHIVRCSTLTRLKLARNKTIGDDSLPYLRQLKQLKSLDLYGTRVTFNGLIKLKGMPLKFLQIERTACTREQLHKLKAAFPGLMVIEWPLGPAIDDETNVIFQPLK